MAQSPDLANTCIVQSQSKALVFADARVPALIILAYPDEEHELDFQKLT